MRLSNFQRRPSRIDAVWADFGGKAGWVRNNNISGIGHGEDGLRTYGLLASGFVTSAFIIQCGFFNENRFIFVDILCAFPWPAETLTGKIF